MLSWTTNSPSHLDSCVPFFSSGTLYSGSLFTNAFTSSPPSVSRDLFRSTGSYFRTWVVVTSDEFYFTLSALWLWRYARFTSVLSFRGFFSLRIEIARKSSLTKKPTYLYPGISIIPSSNLELLSTSLVVFYFCRILFSKAKVSYGRSLLYPSAPINNTLRTLFLFSLETSNTNIIAVPKPRPYNGKELSPVFDNIFGVLLSTFLYTKQ